MRTPYDHLTDQELLRLIMFTNDPLVQALAERLEMRLRDIQELERQSGETDGNHP